MAATFTDYIRAKGINEGSAYTIRQVAGMLGLSYNTIYEYCYLGRRTKRYGIIHLATWRSGSRWEILGRDLIEFLRQVNES